jgi:hypothetical protein
MQHLADSSRAGFFLGDGAGVGKGRTIAGLIWENWKRGRKKALYVVIRRLVFRIHNCYFISVALLVKIS